MLSIKEKTHNNTVTESKNFWQARRQTGHRWGNKQWVWGYVDRNFLSWKAKRKKELKKKDRIDYPRTVRQLQKVFIYGITKREEKKKGVEVYEGQHGWEFPKLITDTRKLRRHQVG